MRSLPWAVGARRRRRRLRSRILSSFFDVDVFVASEVTEDARRGRLRARRSRRGARARSRRAADRGGGRRLRAAGSGSGFGFVGHVFASALAMARAYGGDTLVTS